MKKLTIDCCADCKYHEIDVNHEDTPPELWGKQVCWHESMKQYSGLPIVLDFDPECGIHKDCPLEDV